MREKLIILPFDHRSSFLKNIVGIAENPTPEQIKLIKDLKHMIFEAFCSVRDKQENKDDFAILVDEEYGTEIINEAKELGINFIVSVEKSGQEAFDFEHGESFGQYIESVNPTFVKALVRYNPENIPSNTLQLEKLEKLSVFCQNQGRQLLFELLVPPTEYDLENFGGQEAYDTKIRAEKTQEAILEIKSKVKVDIWKLEGFEKEQWPNILSEIDGNSRVIVLGRGEDKDQVKRWLTNAAPFEQIIGFAIGRTVFSTPLKSFLSGNIGKDTAISEISENFLEFVDLWKLKKAGN